MSLTRKFLKALGLDDEKIDQVIEAHTETVDALKKERDTFKADAESLPDVAKERDKLQKDIEALKAKAPDAAKVQADFDAYKAHVEAEKTNAQKAALLADALKAAGVVRDSAVKALLKVVDLSTVNLTKDGALEGVDALIAPLKTDFADFFATTQQDGIPTATPPTPGGAGMTRDAFKKLTMLQQMEYLNAHPGEGKALL